jgi:hypothetical protein
MRQGDIGMAFLDFRTAELSGSIGGARWISSELEAPAPARSFSPLEWLVIALAERDHIGSLEVPGRIAMALGRIFGSRDEPRLADPRLEALRRLAVLAWHRGFNVPPSELAAFQSAGFTTGHAETLLQTVLARRATRRSRKSA